MRRTPESGERRWFVRVRGEQKDVFTIWFHLRQRTLHYETYVMPAPEANHAAFYEHLLRRNLKLFGAFAIGDEEAIFLVGQLPNHAGRRRRARDSGARLAVRVGRAVPRPALRVRLPLQRMGSSLSLRCISIRASVGSPGTDAASRRSGVGSCPLTSRIAHSESRPVGAPRPAGRYVTRRDRAQAPGDRRREDGGGPARRAAGAVGRRAEALRVVELLPARPTELRDAFPGLVVADEPSVADAT